MIFKFQNKQYKVWWNHITPNEIKIYNKETGLSAIPGTICFIQEFKNEEAAGYAATTKLHPKDQYRKTDGRRISFRYAVVKFLEQIPDINIMMTEFNKILYQYQQQMPKDFFSVVGGEDLSLKK